MFEFPFPTDKIIDRQDFTRNLFNRSYFSALDYSFILLMIHLTGDASHYALLEEQVRRARSDDGRLQCGNICM